MLSSWFYIAELQPKFWKHSLQWRLLVRNVCKICSVWNLFDVTFSEGYYRRRCWESSCFKTLLSFWNLDVWLRCVLLEVVIKSISRERTSLMPVNLDVSTHTKTNEQQNSLSYVTSKITMNIAHISCLYFETNDPLKIHVPFCLLSNCVLKINMYCQSHITNSKF
mgnify:FL=1